MNAFWTYFWPALGAGLAAGIIAGAFAFRVKIIRVRERPHDPDLVQPPRRRRILALALGLIAAIGAALVWHGPLGAADRLANEVERSARQVLVDNYAPAGVTVRMHRAPLTRQLILSGPADDFQRGESVRLLRQIPGVSDATWTAPAGVPLIVQGAFAAVLGFLLGLLVAYLIELRRRYNSQWNW